MRSFARFFASLLCLAPMASWSAAPLTGTAGSNLTAFNGNIGSMNNNNWNQIVNPGKPLPTADFGNCNALVLRCAQPKCASGGCVSMDIAYPIVQGCVMSNETCRNHGDALIQTIAAQIVANSTARANDQAMQANAMMAQAAAAESSQQLGAMQEQMQAMQAQMAQQNEQSAAAMQAALDQQREIMAQQQAAQIAAPIEAAQTTNTPNSIAGVSADVLAREQATGQIMTQLENAEVALKTLKKTMQNSFDYAGCDSSGSNCKGPKRVKAFKQKAGEFFEPYETVLDEVYDGLIMAQSLGVDITDIYMMLNGSCNVWGKYLCTNGQPMHYTNESCDPATGKSRSYNNGKETGVNGGMQCKSGQVIPMNDGGCQLIQMLNNNEDIQRDWLNPEYTEREGKIISEVRVGCASEALDNSMLFRGRKKQASIDIQVLERMLQQDAPSTIQTGKKANPNATKYCSVDSEGLENLQRYTSLKRLPTKVCVKDKEGTPNSLQHKELHDITGTAAAETTDTTSKRDNGCNDEENDRINQEVALCSAHAYNIGAIENPEDAAARVAMDEVVALKTTVMTQQMKKQYDFLETTIKRFKIQLEKAILVSKMEAAGAEGSINSPDGRGSGSSRSSALAGTENCGWGRSSNETLSCLQRNIIEVNKAISAKDFTNASKVVQQDVNTLKGLITAYKTKDNDLNDENLTKNCPDRLNLTNAPGCMSTITGTIMAIERQIKLDSTPSYR